MKKSIRFLKILLIGILGLLLLVVVVLAISIPVGKNSDHQIALGGQELSAYVITNVNLVPMDSNYVMENSNLYVRNGEILRITPDTSEIEAGFTIIEGRGNYLVPGLIDMHAHIFDRADLTQYLSYGITTVRNMMGFPMHLRWKDQLGKGEFPGSRMITASPTLNSGDDVGPFHSRIGDIGEVEALIQKFAESGYDFIKVYDGINARQFEAIQEAAKRHKMPIAGHPPAVDLPVLLASDLVSIEHIEEVLIGLLDVDLNEVEARQLAHKFKVNNIPVVVTLAAYHKIYRTVLEGGGFLEGVPEDELNPLMVFIGNKQLGDYTNAGPKYTAYTKKKYAAMERLTRIFEQEGVELLFGTDTGPNLTIPGITAHEELELLTKAGLTPYEILKSATINAAKALGMSDEIGVLSVGTRAEFMMVSDNPLANINVLQNQSGLAFGGRWYSQVDLARLKSIGKEKVSTFATIGNFLNHLLSK